MRLATARDEIEPLRDVQARQNEAYLAVLLLAPFIGLYPVFMMKALCYAIFACAFNLLLGYTGLLSFGHAAFLGTAGYVCGLMVRDVGVTPEIGILAGTVCAGLLGWVEPSTFGKEIEEETAKLESYRQLMDRLLPQQNRDGLWRNVVDHPGAVQRSAQRGQVGAIHTHRRARADVRHGTSAGHFRGSGT